MKIDKVKGERKSMNVHEHGMVFAAQYVINIEMRV